MTEVTLSLDLHVLSPPLTFALSQDQTLHMNCLFPTASLVFQPGDYRVLTSIYYVVAPLASNRGWLRGLDDKTHSILSLAI